MPVTVTDEADGSWRRSIGRRDVTTWSSRAGRSLSAAHGRLARRSGPVPATASVLVAGAAVALTATAAAVAVYDGMTGRDGIARLDRPALRRARRLRSRPLAAASALIARAAGPVGMPVIAGTMAIALSWRRGSAAPAALVAAAAAGSLAMSLVGKGVVHRNRPPRRDAIPPFETSPSFPSGHTLTATSILGVVAYSAMLDQRSLRSQRITAAGAVLAILATGLSRVLLGAHWLSDVAMGWAAGAGWMSIVVTADRLHATARRGAIPDRPAAGDASGPPGGSGAMRANGRRE